jgi:hypothetical protein
MVWIVFIENVKCVRIVGLYHVIRFFCLPFRGGLERKYIAAAAALG